MTAMISAAAMASKEEVTLGDLLWEGAGNLPRDYGVIIGTVSFISDMFNPEYYEPNDFEKLICCSTD